MRGRLEPTLASIPADEATCLPSHLDACVAELARETFASDVIKSKKVYREEEGGTRPAG